MTTPSTAAKREGVVLVSKNLAQQNCQPLWLMYSSSNNAKRASAAAALISSSSVESEIVALMGGDGYILEKILTLDDLQKSLQIFLSTSKTTTTANGPAKRNEASAKNQCYPQGLDEIKRFELFREMIEHEDNLLNQRVSWIILAQSFLMAAFISAATNVENRSFLYITAGVGLATVVVTMPALIAAGQNIEVQQRVYFLGLQSDEQCQELHGHDRDTLRKPPEEMALRRSKGHILPNTAFRGRFGIPILNTVMALAVVQVAGWCGLLAALMMDG
jgi:ribosomal protein S8